METIQQFRKGGRVRKNKQMVQSNKQSQKVIVNIGSRSNPDSKKERKANPQRVPSYAPQFALQEPMFQHVLPSAPRVQSQPVAVQQFQREENLVRNQPYESVLRTRQPNGNIPFHQVNSSVGIGIGQQSDPNTPVRINLQIPQAPIKLDRSSSSAISLFSPSLEPLDERHAIAHGQDEPDEVFRPYFNYGFSHDLYDNFHLNVPENERITVINDDGTMTWGKNYSFSDQLPRSLSAIDFGVKKPLQLEDSSQASSSSSSSAQASSFDDKHFEGSYDTDYRRKHQPSWNFQ